MKTHLILVGLLCICSLSFGQDCSQQLLENVDFPGTDITFVYSPDVEHCQLLCTQHASCLFFTFIRADWTRDNRHFYCYLKTTPSGQPNVRTPLLGVTSGFSLKSCNSDLQPCLSKVYQNIDFLGADYRTLFTADYEGCQRECTRDPACQFFTYATGVYTTEKIRYKCHLKFSWAVPRTPIVEKKTGVISGFSHNVQMAQDSDIGTQTACQGKLFPSTDIPGGDFMTLPAASPEHCQTLCSAHPSCTFFSFVSNNFNCHLKGNKNEMVITAKAGVTSGLPAHFCQLDNNSCRQALLRDVDFPGSDIKHVTSPDAEHCQLLCTQHPACRFFTFLRPDWTRDNRQFFCYLKGSPSGQPRVQNTLHGHTSGFSLKPCNPDPKPCLRGVYHHVDFHGADFRTLFTANYEECQRECTRDPACQFFTFIKGNYRDERIRYKCHLKFSWTVPRTPTVLAKGGIVSGFSHNLPINSGHCTTACQGKLFPNIDVPGHDVEVLPAASPEHCQILCSAHHHCTFFAYVSYQFKCYLKNNPQAMNPRHVGGITSGLPTHFCQLDTNWLQRKYVGVDFPFDDIRHFVVGDVERCQRTCTDDPNCQYYSYITHSRLCYHKRVIILPAPSRVIKLANVVSGFSLKTCP